MRIDGRDFRTIWLDEGGRDVWVIDQRRLPHRFETLRLTSAGAAARAISDMTVRGAPLIGAAAAWGMALASSNNGYDRGYYDRGYYAPQPAYSYAPEPTYYQGPVYYSSYRNCRVQWRWDRRWGRYERGRACY